MDNELKPIGKDADGGDYLKTAVKILLNQFPGLYPDEEIKFEELGDESGIAFSNATGALVYAKTEDVWAVSIRRASILFMSCTGPLGVPKSDRK